MDHEDRPLSDSPSQSNLTRPGASRFSRRAALIGAACLIGGGTATSLLVNRFSTKPSKSSRLSLYTYHGNPSSLNDVTWSPDGRRIASAGLSVQVWDAFNGEHAFTCTDSTNTNIGGNHIVEWSPDGQFIAASINREDTNTDSSFTVQVWNASNGKLVHTFPRGGSVAWSPDGKRIATGGENVQVWNASNGKLVYTFPGGGSVAWSPDGKRIASTGKNVQVRNASDGSDAIVYTDLSSDSSQALAWSPDSQRLVYSDPGTLEIWDASTGHHLSTYDVHGGAFMDYFSPVYDLAWSPNGKYIASASEDKTVEICNATTGERVFTYTGHSDKVVAVKWSPDGKYLASASWDSTVQVWSPG